MSGTESYEILSFTIVFGILRDPILAKTARINQLMTENADTFCQMIKCVEVFLTEILYACVTNCIFL